MNLFPFAKIKYKNLTIAGMIFYTKKVEFFLCVINWPSVLTIFFTENKHANNICILKLRRNSQIINFGLLLGFKYYSKLKQWSTYK